MSRREDGISERRHVQHPSHIPARLPLEPRRPRQNTPCGQPILRLTGFLHSVCCMYSFSHHLAYLFANLLTGSFLEVREYGTRAADKTH